MGAGVTATPAALEAIRRLQATEGPISMFQSGGCCDGSLPLCLTAAEMPAGPGDVMLGVLEEMPFYVDGEQHRRWGEPSFVIDLSPGAPEGFSLAPSAHEHFVSRSPGSEPTKPGATTPGPRGPPRPRCDR